MTTFANVMRSWNHWNTWCCMVWCAIAGIMAVYSGAFAQQISGVQNSGRIVNLGTIELAGKKNFTSAAGSTLTNAAFRTNGTLTLTGSENTFAQDSIAGLTAFVQDDSLRTASQRVPALTYFQLALRGRSAKNVTLTSATARNLVVADTLTIRSTPDSSPNVLLRVQVPATSAIEARGDALLNGAVSGAVFCTGTRQQALSGSGSVTALVVDNPTTVLLADTLPLPFALHIERRLELLRGDVRPQSASVNPASTLVSFGDSVFVLRASGTSFAVEPHFGRAASVRYTGNGAVTASGELPADATVLQRLENLTMGGVTLTKSVTVNDSLILASSLRTGAHVLTFQRAETARNPAFLADSVEIAGSVRRFTSGRDTLARLYNNRYMFIQCAKPLATGAASNLASVILRSTPDAFPEPDANADKIRRGFQIRVLNARGEQIALGDAGNAGDTTALLRIGYGWRFRPRNETNSLDANTVLLQRHDGRTWKTVGVPQNLQAALASGSWNTRTDNALWYVGVADSVKASAITAGDNFFALGADPDFGFLQPTTLSIRAALEGALLAQSQSTVQSSVLMNNTLQRSNVLPMTLPGVYPYTLLGARREQTRVQMLPDSVVDWVVVEVRRSAASGLKRGIDSANTFPALLKQSGMVTGLDGRSSLVFRRSSFEPASGYFLVLHHRNHLATASAQQQDFRPNSTASFDFTRAEAVLGGADALKVAGSVLLGNAFFAVPVGDVDANGVIDRADYDGLQSAWINVFSEGYSAFDTDLDGTITTLDMNRIWNNRGRTSRAPFATTLLRR